MNTSSELPQYTNIYFCIFLWWLIMSLKKCNNVWSIVTAFLCGQWGGVLFGVYLPYYLATQEINSKARSVTIWWSAIPFYILLFIYTIKWQIGWQLHRISCQTKLHPHEFLSTCLSGINNFITFAAMWDLISIALLILHLITISCQLCQLW